MFLNFGDKLKLELIFLYILNNFKGNYCEGI